ncbi:unnamed protein product [Choristocarpus tenellus]
MESPIAANRALQDTLGGIFLCFMTTLGAVVIVLMLQSGGGKEEEEAKPEPVVPRNFTIEQLHDFDGRDDETQAYVAIRGEVFDVSSKANFYKKGGSYNVFAGHDASVNLATGSLSPDTLDSSWADLNPMEKDSLDEWVDKYKHFNDYPVVGRVVAPLPDPKKVFTLEELRVLNGTGDVPEGHGAPPICVGIKGKVYDMSYGGGPMYGPGKSYNLFAGRDASVALAKV